MSHQIDITDLSDYVFTHEIAASHRKGSSKTLRAVVAGSNITYEVFSHKEQKIETASLEYAIEIYNRQP